MPGEVVDEDPVEPEVLPDVPDSLGEVLEEPGEVMLPELGEVLDEPEESLGAVLEEPAAPEEPEVP